MLALIRSPNVDMVIATRERHGSSISGLSEQRSLISNFGKLLSRLVIKTDVNDPMSGFFMARRDIVEDVAPNAFATGRNPEHSLIAFTTGLLNRMDRDELQGVIAHELSHVANRDTLVSAVAATTAGAIAILSDFLMRLMWFGGSRDRDADRKVRVDRHVHGI